MKLTKLHDLDSKLSNKHHPFFFRKKNDEKKQLIHAMMVSIINDYQLNAYEQQTVAKSRKLRKI